MKISESNWFTFWILFFLIIGGSVPNFGLKVFFVFTSFFAVYVILPVVVEQ